MLAGKLIRDLAVHAVGNELHGHHIAGQRPADDRLGQALEGGLTAFGVTLPQRSA